jgi:carboxypeptidase family protein
VHRVFRRAAAVLAATTLGAALLASPASAADTGLSGVVTGSDGTPLSTCLEVVSPTGDYAGTTCTDEFGAWSLPDLPDGDYKVWIGGVDFFAGEWFDDAVDFDLATVVTSPATLSTTLELQGRLSGTLTDADGAAVPFTNVTVVDTAGTEVANSYTDDQGSWTVLVGPGEYKVHFSGYPVSQWAFGAADEGAAAVLSVTAGETTAVDDHLLPVTTVSGTVTDTKGRPLENICASLVNPDDFTPWDSFGQSCTGPDGRYEVVPWGAAPAATVWFQDFSEVAVYAAEFAGGAYDVPGAQRIDLSGGDVVVDATLAVGGVITGKAVTERKPNGIAGVCPSAYAGHTGDQLWGAGTTCSGANGVYRLTALPPGDTAVLLQPNFRSGVSDEWYQDADSQATAKLAKVSLGATTTLKSNKFVPGGTLTGVVTDTSGQPVVGAYVYLEGRYPGRAGPGEGRFVAQTDAAGRYTMIAPAGTYTPFVDAPYEAGLAPEWSGNAVTRATAAPVVVRDYRTSTFDAALVPASHITGTVVNADGSAPSPETYIAGYIYTQSGEYIGDLDAWVDSDFRFFGSNLPAGSFRIRADVIDQNTGDSSSVWFDGVTTEGGATLVPVGPGETTDITFHLR